jgi:hypothetical protein
MVLGMAEFSQPRGEFHGREDMLSDSTVPHPAIPSASHASISSKALPGLANARFTIGDGPE